MYNDSKLQLQQSHISEFGMGGNKDLSRMIVVGVGTFLMIRESSL